MQGGGQGGHQPQRQPETEDADRHVDEEDPLPAEAVHQDSPGDRADQGGHPGGRAPHAHRHAATSSREDAGDHGQRLRRQQCGTESLHHPSGDEHFDGTGQPAPQRGGGEHRQPDEVEVLGPEPVTEAARHQQRDGEGEQIGAGHPDHTVVVGVQLLHDALVGDGDDCRVDEDHEEPDQHRPEGMPGIGRAGSLGQSGGRGHASISGVLEHLLRHREIGDLPDATDPPDSRQVRDDHTATTGVITPVRAVDRRAPRRRLPRRGTDDRRTPWPPTRPPTPPT